jgi:(4S)-4-hydroxy-5-phosphonooxypentane-2,3-dione isomerase
MHIIHVQIHVKPEAVEGFKTATRANAQASLKESGVVRFDFVQQQDDPTRFVLIEVYRTVDDQAKHKQTAHYTTWSESVAPMMAEPRSSAKYIDLFPEEAGW